MMARIVAWGPFRSSLYNAIFYGGLAGLMRLSMRELGWVEKGSWVLWIPTILFLIVTIGEIRREP